MPTPPHARLLPLEKLLAPPDGAAKLTARARRCLKARIEATGHYPALIVRPRPGRSGMFEILDGAVRSAILAELGRASARCEVWSVDDDEAELLRVTLNEFRGRLGPATRARRLGRLVGRLGANRVAEAIGLTSASLGRSLAQGRPPAVRARSAALDLRPVVFHLPPGRAEQLAEALAALSAEPTSRAEALVRAVEAAAREAERPVKR
jgi:ParB-like chromosome segregation protein Spo0J